MNARWRRSPLLRCERDCSLPLIYSWISCNRTYPSMSTANLRSPINIYFMRFPSKLLLEMWFQPTPALQMHCGRQFATSQHMHSAMKKRHSSLCGLIAMFVSFSLALYRLWLNLAQRAGFCCCPVHLCVRFFHANYLNWMAAKNLWKYIQTRIGWEKTSSYAPDKWSKYIKPIHMQQCSPNQRSFLFCLSERKRQRKRGHHFERYKSQLLRMGFAAQKYHIICFGEQCEHWTSINGKADFCLVRSPDYFLSLKRQPSIELNHSFMWCVFNFSVFAPYYGIFSIFTDKNWFQFN